MADYLSRIAHKDAPRTGMGTEQIVSVSSVREDVATDLMKIIGVDEIKERQRECPVTKHLMEAIIKSSRFGKEPDVRRLKSVEKGG